MPINKNSDLKAKKQESFEATLWQTADKLRKNMDAGEYKHVVLGLIFLKYISGCLFPRKRPVIPV